MTHPTFQQIGVKAIAQSVDGPSRFSQLPPPFAAQQPLASSADGLQAPSDRWLH